MYHELVSLKLLHPFIQTILSVLFVIGFHQFCLICNDKFTILKKSKLDQIFKISLIFFIFVFLLNIFIWTNSYNKLFFKIIFFSLLLLSFKYLLSFRLKKIKKWNSIKVLISVFLILYFLLSITPITDADSIAYHSAFAIQTINNIDMNWISDHVKVQPHSYLIGSLEAVNFIGLYFGIENFSSLFSFYFLFIFCIKIFSFKNFKSNLDIKYYCLLSILSCPMMISIISSQKPFLIPAILLSSIFFFLLNNYQKENYIDNSIIIIILINIIPIKATFIPYVLLSLIYFFIISKKKFFLLNINFLFFLIIIFPFIYKNYFYFNDFFPPFSGDLLNNNNFLNKNFINDLRNYDLYFSIKHLLYLPILFLIPYTVNNGVIIINILNYTKSLGLGIYNFILLKKNKFNLIFFLSLFIIPIILGNISTRWFFVFFLTVNLFLITKKFINKKLFYLIILQSGFTFLGLIFSLYLLLPGSFDKSKKEEILKNMAFEYDYSTKVYSLADKFKLKKNDLILYNSRNNYWLSGDKRFINLGYSSLGNELNSEIDYLDYLKTQNVKIIVSDNKTILKLKNLMNKKCKYFIDEFNTIIATRNPFNSAKDQITYIYIPNSSKNCFN